MQRKIITKTGTPQLVRVVPPTKQKPQATKQLTSIGNDTKINKAK